MNTVAFDGLVQELENASTRRSIFRLLGGVAAVGAGLAVASGDESQAKGRGKASRGRGNNHSHDAVSAQGKGKKVTICYQNQTRMVKKIKIADDSSIYHVTADRFLLTNNDGLTTEHDPIVVSAKAGDELEVYARNYGPCRFFAPVARQCIQNE